MMAEDSSVLTTQVAIVGAGPCGVLLANILGNYGIDVTVIDRETQIMPYPRAVGMDDESLRTMQLIDLAEDQLVDMIQNVPLRFFDRAGHVLADIKPSTREFGWSRRNIFMQQNCEKVLRRGLGRFPTVQMMLGHDVNAVEQSDDSCTVRLTGPDGQPIRLNAAYVVGADGGRSSVREFLGIPLEGKTDARKWVVIDCENDLIDAAYTALHGEPDRPYVCIHLPHGYRRWEFMLFPGEDAEAMLDSERVHALLARHVSDPQSLNIIRSRVYTHHARVARSFQSDRVFLAGDAAHLMPPWAGQGLNTGIRDVTNLGWKLAGVLSGRFGPQLLKSYETERKPHATAMVSMSATLGRLLSPTSRNIARLRDVVLRGLGLVPSIRQWVLEMKFKPMPHYSQGAVVPEPHAAKHRSVGKMIVQPSVRIDDGSTVKLDDALGDWLAMLGWDCDPAEYLSAEQISTFLRMGGTFFKIVGSCAPPSRRTTYFTETLVLEDVDGVLRPWFTDRRIDAAIIRPDRYVAATATRAELTARTEALLRTLHVPQTASTPPTVERTAV